MASRIYRHRVNTIEGLHAVPTSMGLEFDLRSSGDRVIVTHDPFTEGPTVEEFFPHIGPRPCIFNVKCEGIEAHLTALAKQHGITDYFMLDVSIPAAMKLVRAGDDRFAVRWSEVEPREAVLAWRGRARWVWVDCFDNYPGDAATWAEIAGAFQVCLVSPELQAHTGPVYDRIRGQLEGRRFDAVCTKTPERWS